MLALQATNAVHLVFDNLNVVRHVGRLLDGSSGIRPLELEDDGDLIILIRKLLSIRGEGTVCISKVKGHADESLVRSGQVRALDRYGNSRADEVADFGRRRVWPEVTDARRNLCGVCRRWSFHFWDSGWVRVPPVAISAEDVCLCRTLFDILIKIVTFLGSLHWSSAGNDLVSPMLSFLFFMSSGLVTGFSLRRLFLAA